MGKRELYNSRATWAKMASSAHIDIICKGDIFTYHQEVVCWVSEGPRTYHQSTTYCWMINIDVLNEFNTFPATPKWNYIKIHSLFFKIPHPAASSHNRCLLWGFDWFCWGIPAIVKTNWVLFVNSDYTHTHGESSRRHKHMVGSPPLCWRTNWIPPESTFSS